jgi:LmbE family N-acetylglucosaminyl deacetylase
MEPFDPTPRRWLFAMTHPDDEIAIVAWMHHLIQHDSEVWVSWTHHTEVREAEGRRVAERLGIPQDRLFFHGAEDGNVCDELNRLRDPFARMMDSVKPDRVVTTAFEQGHLDHDSTNWLVNHTYGGPIFEVPLYYSYLTRIPRINRFADPTGQAVREVPPDEQAIKLAIAKSYPSQAIWKNLLFAELRARLMGEGSLVKTERMRLQKATDFTKVALPEPLASRVAKSERWQRWLRALQAT